MNLRKMTSAGLGLPVLLCLLPAWLRAEEPPAEKRLIEAKRVLELQLNTLQRATPNPEADKAAADARKLEAELALKQAELKALEQKLKAAQDRAKKVEAPPLGTAPGVRVWSVAGGEKKGVVTWDKLQLEVKPVAPQKGVVYELVPGEKGTLILRPVAAAPAVPNPNPWRVEIAPNVPKTVVQPPPIINVVPRRPSEADERAKNLEKRLDDIMKELEQLRKEIKAPAPKPMNPYVPAKPQEQGKLVPGQPGVIILRLDDLRGQAVEKRVEAVRELQAARNELEQRLKAQEALGQQPEQKEAEAAVEQARLVLEKLRAVANEDSPQVKAAEARLAEARARLAAINRIRLLQKETQKNP